ncbi:hypothetical protein AYI70_g12161 [Smittium culicis]|uniref:Uncharacterized protein n=1 Tax=Smittium culicis TaxID=133412 RepID=A0A1R1WYP1_9FUNG|nr:hypothetical protein AYI70_g12161 [Smittium culicis]
MSVCDIESSFNQFLVNSQASNPYTNFLSSFLVPSLSSSDPFVFGIGLCFLLALSVYILSLVPVGSQNKRNYSYVDRLWSLTPVIYSLIYVAAMYTRYPDVPITSPHFPAKAAVRLRQFFIIESPKLTRLYFSDQQQYNYQTAKYAYIKARKDNRVNIDYKYESGFVHTGLFSYSRHPNYFCEQLFWLTISLYSIYSSNCFATENITSNYFNSLYLVGSLTLIVLFHFSTQLAENISSSKYPQYSIYASKTCRVVPFFKSKFVPSKLS